MRHGGTSVSRTCNKPQGWPAGASDFNDPMVVPSGRPYSDYTRDRYRKPDITRHLRWRPEHCPVFGGKTGAPLNLVWELTGHTPPTSACHRIQSVHFDHSHGTYWNLVVLIVTGRGTCLRRCVRRPGPAVTGSGQLAHTWRRPPTEREMSRKRPA